jgi:hypothetical protein
MRSNEFSDKDVDTKAGDADLRRPGRYKTCDERQISHEER